MKPSPSSETHYGKAASEIIHPTQPQTDYGEQTRQVDHYVKVLHPRHSEIQSRASNSKSSDVTELAEHLKEMRVRWRRPNYKPTVHSALHHQIKREPFLFRDYIHYNVQIPHRASLQVQRLVGTTKVHLNDREVVLKIQDRIGQEEVTELKRKERYRKTVEYNRLKKLVIDGTIDASMLPPEHQSLTAHPAYRATNILKRLDAYKKSSQLENVKIINNIKINPVEPYEFNGDKYFKHLHKTGNADWVPSRVRKERKKVSKVKDAEPTKSSKQKPLRTLFKRKVTEESDFSDPNLPRDLLLSNLPSTEFRSSTRVDLDDKYKLSAKELTLYMQEQIETEAREQQERDQQRNSRNMSMERWSMQQKANAERVNVSSTALGAMQVPNSLEQLLKTFGISDMIDCYQNRQEDGRLIKYIDGSEGANELFGNAEALNKLYARETKFAEKFPFQRFNERFNLPYEYSVSGRK